MHAVTHAADLFHSKAWLHTDVEEFFQNYEIYIGNDSDYNKNAKCAGGPFLRIDDPNSFVYNEYAAQEGSDPLG